MIKTSNYIKEISLDLRSRTKFFIQCKKCGSKGSDIRLGIISFKGTRSVFIPEDEIVIECKKCDEK